MKDLQNQYRLIKEGKGNKSHLMKTARHLFPDLITPTLTYNDTVKILKQKNILSEDIGGVVTAGTKQDWQKIFNENMKEELDLRTPEGKKLSKLFDKKPEDLKKKYQDQQKNPNKSLFKEYGEDSGGQDMTWGGIYKDKGTGISDMDLMYKYSSDIAKEIADEISDDYNNAQVEDLVSKYMSEQEISQDVINKVLGDEEWWDQLYDNINTFKKDGTDEMIKRHEEEQDAKHTLPNIGNLREAKEVKAIEKETTKEVTDMATRGYDYKNTKSYDNVFGEEFLKGFYTEMGDSKNEGKTVEELKSIVAKNLAKDLSHYVKDGQFGLKGVGYTTEAPGLGEPKAAKGKHKSSGYGDLKENKETADEKITRYEKYKYVLDGKTVKPDEIAYYGNILKAELNGELYRLAIPENDTVELISIKGKTGMYTESLKESVLRAQIHQLIKETLAEGKK